MFCLYNKTPFIFIHAPKTGGGSLKLLLAKNFKRKINILKTKDINLNINYNRFLFLKSLKNFQFNIESPLFYHASYSDYYRLIRKRYFTKIFKFSVIRNPYERFFSLYKWHKNLTQNVENTDLKNFNEKSIKLSLARKTFGNSYDFKFSTFNDFVSNYKLLNKFDIKNMVEYGILNCDKLIKFENFENDSKILLKDLGIDDSIPHIHKTDLLNYREYYSEESRKIVSEIYKKDLSTFGYKF